MAGPIVIMVIFVLGTSTNAQVLSNGSFENGFDDWSASGSVGPSGSEGTSHGNLAALFNAGDTPIDGVLSQSF